MGTVLATIVNRYQQLKQGQTANLRPFLGTVAFLSLFDLVLLSTNLLVEGLKRRFTATDSEYVIAVGLVVLQNTAFVAGILCVFFLLGRLHQRVQGWELPRLHADWVVCGVALIPLAIYLSSGGGVRQLMPRWVAAALLGVVLLSAGRIVLATMRRLTGWLICGRSTPRLLARLALVATAVAALLADRWLLVGLYQPLHLMLAAGATFLVVIALTDARDDSPRLRPHWLAGIAALGIALSMASSAWLPLAHTRAVLDATGPRYSARLANPLTRLVDNLLGDDQKQVRAQPSDGAAVPPLFEGGEPPHVLIISIDGVRASHTSLLGHRRPTTPFLSELAGQALVFERAYAPSANTQHSLAAILGNRAVDVRRPPDGADMKDFCADQPVADTLPALFARTGYETRCDFAYARRHLGCVALGCHIRSDRRDRDKSFELIWETLNSSTKPIFGLVHLLETHAPYTGFDQKLIDQTPGWSRYERSLRGMDEALARFYRRTNNLTDRPILWVFLSDHGEALGDHGHSTHDSSLFEEQVHIPLLLVGPGVQSGRITEPVSAQWLYGTLRSLAGQPPAGDLLPLAADQTPPAPVFLHNKDLYGAVDGTWKYIEDRSTGARWLFDLGNDPSEEHNLLGQHPERARRLEGLVRQHFEQ